jgi:DNA-binding MarR family transcriptional regulator
MVSRYLLTPTQTKVLRALAQAAELSPAEVAVEARLLPTQVIPALDALERMRLIASVYPITARTGERLLSLTSEGQAVLRALAPFRGTPPVGTVLPLSGSSFSGSGLLGVSPIVGSGGPHAEIISEESNR